MPDPTAPGEPMLLDGRSLASASIEAIRYFEPPEGYWLAFSGGKDSIVLHDLAERSGVTFEAHYNVTTTDPPELLRFMVRNYPNLTWERPAKTMWQLIRENGLPTRTRRWCCRALKERGGRGRTVLTGIRSAESSSRRRRGMVEFGLRGSAHKTLVHPIKEWRTDQVWAYIRARSLRYCSLYDEGWRRLGCVLCPFDLHPQREMARWPRLAARWRTAVQRGWDEGTGAWKSYRRKWSSAEALWKAWLNRDGSLKGDLQDCRLFPGAGME